MYPNAICGPNERGEWLVYATPLGDELVARFSDRADAMAYLESVRGPVS